MCGIAGILRFSDGADDRSIVEAMTAMIERRGPDDRGVDRDPVTAHMWYSLSAAAGNPYGKNRKAAVSIMMSPEQLAQSRARANEWSEANWWVAPATVD